VLVIEHIVVLRMCVTLKRKLESVLYVGLKTELAELESAARVFVTCKQYNVVAPLVGGNRWC
jgi:hypothetical protein